VGRALREPTTRGKLTCVNGFGTGIADDKLVHAYVEEMVRFYLGEEPRLRSVTTYDLAEPDVLEEALERIDELVVKPRTGHGGHGVVIAGRETREDREELVSEIRRRPERFVAQETVALSSHPTVIRGRLEPRHVDLRPFVFTIAGEPVVVPGGLTRVAFGEGVLVVNSSQDGGGKDTWVLG
jgi:carboxylate-amine ligase